MNFQELYDQECQLSLRLQETIDKLTARIQLLESLPELVLFLENEKKLSCAVVDFGMDNFSDLPPDESAIVDNAEKIQLEDNLEDDSNRRLLQEQRMKKQIAKQKLLQSNKASISRRRIGAIVAEAPEPAAPIVEQIAPPALSAEDEEELRIQETQKVLKEKQEREQMELERLRRQRNRSKLLQKKKGTEEMPVAAPVSVSLSVTSSQSVVASTEDLSGSKQQSSNKNLINKKSVAVPASLWDSSSSSEDEQSLNTKTQKQAVKAPTPVPASVVRNLTPPPSQYSRAGEFYTKFDDEEEGDDEVDQEEEGSSSEELLNQKCQLWTQRNYGDVRCMIRTLHEMMDVSSILAGDDECRGWDLQQLLYNVCNRVDIRTQDLCLSPGEVRKAYL